MTYMPRFYSDFIRLAQIAGRHLYIYVASSSCMLLRATMSKRALSPSASPPPKRPRISSTFRPRKIATADAASAVDSEPPLSLLLETAKNVKSKVKAGSSVVFWMRMGDLRSFADNRALSLASAHAKKADVPLVVLFVLSPQDYKAHDRSPRRIDFTLRNLALIKMSLEEKHIPLHTITEPTRRVIPQKVVSFLEHLDALAIYANIEYEVDELRRDTQICKAAQAKGIGAVFAHDKCVVEPGAVLTKESKTYAVYTPYQKSWLKILNSNIPHFLENCPEPHPNSELVHTMPKFKVLFDTPVPESVLGFELDAADRRKMEESQVTLSKILQRFLHTKSRSSQLSAVDPLAAGAVDSAKQSRIAVYDAERDRADKDTTSRLSPYLAAGVISARSCVRATMPDTQNGAKRVDGGRWIQEIAWRDFYVCILAGYPRGPALEDAYGEGQGRSNPKAELPLATVESNIEKWKTGQTGFPIVDAGMRCLNEMGYLHNRARMICAMFLVKDLMVDWRIGEKHFMEKLIDGDLASNNGGWQWCASTGVDSCPYFRIFNPHNQSSKADPTGDFIRHFVPELRSVRGPDLHNPSASVADKLGYPRPIVKHEESRARAMRRFKDPGSP
ncbi:Deoxyribodipyrimidine photo-lyase [Mycena sanguinolenta]|uniref:Deoxyribodipyrimidine photo-lyase n=1 Tax=Mycena sanguinolenta TaxID=230812 RepID=A0A8H6YA65_9AGAR|nr:Deoxyribodipyrimidine photo-lyase [Mycena sanguinolenta]